MIFAIAIGLAVLVPSVLYFLEADKNIRKML